jgi:hypothetical protein
MGSSKNIGIWVTASWDNEIASKRGNIDGALIVFLSGVMLDCLSD